MLYTAERSALNNIQVQEKQPPVVLTWVNFTHADKSNESRVAICVKKIEMMMLNSDETDANTT